MLVAAEHLANHIRGPGRLSHGPVRRIALADVVYEVSLGPALRDRAVRARRISMIPADLAFLIRDDADRALSARHHTAARLFVKFLALRTSHRRPAETQRSGLSAYSWPCGHLTLRPAVTQRLVLSS